MFTGLVEGCVTLEASVPLQGDDGAAGVRWTVSAQDMSQLLTEARVGDSMALNGVCTTITTLPTPTSFTVELSPETLQKTTFAQARVGQTFNVERPLKVGDRLGGHWVSGHVDSTARVIDRLQDGISWVFYFRINNPADACLLIPKGSVTIDGVSLTVNTVEGPVFSVAIIPHTWEQTTFHTLMPDDSVNIEFDLLGKYVRQLMGTALVPSEAATAGAGVAPGVTPFAPSRTGVEQYGPSRIHTGSWFNQPGQ